MLKLPDSFAGATSDSRLVRPGMLFVALKGEKVDGRDFIPQALEKGAAGVVEGLEELQRLASEYRSSLKAKVVGVTGSAGKTTTKEFLRAFLSRAGKTHATGGNFNNHIGLPLTILNTPEDADFLVLEMGTNHPGEIAALCDIARPDAGAISSIGTAHIEFFGSSEGIAREKGVLFERAREFCAVPENIKCKEILRGMAAGRFLEAPCESFLADALSGILPGVHNAMNASVAFRAAAEFGVSREDAVAALDGFSLPGARWSRTEKNGIAFVNDTYNANPDAMKAALATFAEMKGFARRIAVLGDMFELGARGDELHKEVFDFAATLGLDAVYAVGEASSKCRCDAAFKNVDDAKEAVFKLLKPGDAVLLKASHSMDLGRILD